jgi:hypothetical protein
LSDRDEPEEAARDVPSRQKTSPWVFTGFILWGLLPAILLLTARIEGNPLLAIQFLMGSYGMPVILYFWSDTVIRRSGVKAFGSGVALTLLMCIVNAIIAFAGCSVLYPEPFRM